MAEMMAAIREVFMQPVWSENTDTPQIACSFRVGWRSGKVPSETVGCSVAPRFTIISDYFSHTHQLHSCSYWNLWIYSTELKFRWLGSNDEKHFL